jgi:hypothetical protein
MQVGVAHSQPAASAWEVRSSPAVDLWYYGLAAVGFSGPGSLSWYNPDFVATLRSERTSRGFGKSRLEEESGRFARAFRRDTVFEALHFLPLYYASDDASTLTASLRSLSTSGNALAPVFPTAAERKTLAEFADALDAERPYVVQSRARAKLTSQVIDKLDAQWKREFLPVIEQYLRDLGVRRGVLLISPALGSEGRIVRLGDEIIIAVGLGNPRSPAAPLYAAVRELCFPLVGHVNGLTDGVTSRLTAIDVTNRAAVRCGAMLLDISSATMGAEYRRLYLEASSDDWNVPRDFDARFPLTKAVEKSLRAELDRVMLETRTMKR